MTNINRMGRPDDPESNNGERVAAPAGYAPPDNIQDMIARMVHAAIVAEREEPHETIEEADDFEPEDDSMLDMSPYTFANIQDDYVPEEPELLASDTPAEPPETPPALGDAEISPPDGGTAPASPDAPDGQP